MGVSNIKIQGTGRFTSSTKNFGEVDQGEFIGTSSNRGVILSSATFAASSTNIGSISGTASFSGSATNTGTILGSAIFADFTVNTGSVSSVTFAGSAINTGIILGNATFNGDAINTGTINGSVLFTGNSYNKDGIILGTPLTDTPGDSYFINNALLLQGISEPITEDSRRPEVQLLLGGNRTDGSSLSTLIVDSSPVGRTMTRVGNAHVSTNVVKYGTGSLAVLGGGATSSITGTGNISIAANQPFTVEAWVYLLSGGRHSLIGEPAGALYSTNWGFGIFDTIDAYMAQGRVKGLSFWSSMTNGYGGNVVYSGQYPTLSAWTHVAICRDGANNWSFYMNGTKGTTFNSNLSTHAYSQFPANNGPADALTMPVVIGNFNSANLAAGFNGYIDDFRITVGTARYLNNFTPPTTTLIGRTAPFAFVDGSNNNFALTAATVSQGSFSPFSTNGWSEFFNGAANIATTGFSAALTGLGVGKTTFEAWIYPATTFSSANSYNTLIFGSVAAVVANGRWYLGAMSTTSLTSANLKFYYTNSDSTALEIITTNNPVFINKWSHVACTIDATTNSAAIVNIYVNGIRSLSAIANLSTHTSTYGNMAIGGGMTGVNNFNGYITNAKITKNVVYTQPFTPSKVTLTSQGTVPSQVLLLGLDTNTFGNQGLSSVSFTSSTVSSRAFSPFAPIFDYKPSINGGSGYFVGAANVTTNVLTMPISAFKLGSGSFTIDFWVFPTKQAAAGNVNSFDMMGGEASGGGSMWSISCGVVGTMTGVRFKYGLYGSNQTGKGTGNYLTANQWHHIVVQRNVSTLSIYINGVSQPLTTYNENTTWSDTFNFDAVTMTTNKIGGYSLQSFYLSDIRFVRGFALYSGTRFPVPTLPSKAVPGTNLLLNFNKGPVDQTGNCVISPTGNVSYMENVIKYGTGSFYFDGTGDYLSTPNSDLFKFGTGDFTVEWWWYLDSTFASTGGPGIGQKLGDTTGGGGWVIYRNTSVSPTTITVRLATTAGASMVDFSATVAPTVSAWQHWALTRSGTTLRWFCNGVPSGSATNSTNITDTNTTAPMYVGFAQTWSYAIQRSYVTDLRVTKGLARYTTTFTPPSASLPTHG